MKSQTLIGDVHGKVDQYWKLVTHRIDGPSVQVGDFGFKQSHEWHRLNIDARKHRVLFGNHDYYPMLHAPHSLGNWLFEDGICYIRGAHSIDKEFRLANDWPWFEEEELTYAQGSALVELFAEWKPKVVVSHDCPHTVNAALFGIEEKSLTTNILQACLEVHRPELWVFGHHHKSRNEVMDGTRFRCLAELETMQL
jgi:hypothetical protein